MKAPAVSHRSPSGVAAFARVEGNAGRGAAGLVVSLAVLIASVSAPAESMAGLQPSFALKYSAWHATHVVVIDKAGRVLESWKGDLAIGEMLPIQALLLPAPGPITYQVIGKERNLDDLEEVTNTRRVLFLTRAVDARPVSWKPASLFGGMPVSMVWVDAGQVYAIVQVMNPGPSEIVPLEMTEEVFRKAVDDILQLQQAYEEIRAEPDAATRAKRLVPFLETNSYECNQAAFAALADCGKEALPLLRLLLRDEKRLTIHDQLVRALTRAGGQEAKQDLIALLKEDLTYWQQIGPDLKDWWGQEPMTMRYSRTYAILEQLTSLQVTEDDKQTVISLRDFWRLLPQLDRIGKGVGPDGNYVGDSQLVEMADRIVGPVR